MFGAAGRGLWQQGYRDSITSLRSLSARSTENKSRSRELLLGGKVAVGERFGSWLKGATKQDYV
jgi:hypothetical protein